MRSRYSYSLKSVGVMSPRQGELSMQKNVVVDTTGPSKTELTYSEIKSKNYLRVYELKFWNNVYSVG